ncbi:MAG: mechanosensitive ion channel [Clostridia bacterium]|nr:mechanosensitive ion channel [Clostridia bacterium]
MEFFETMAAKFAELCVSFGGKLLAAILVLVIGTIIIKLVMKLLRKKKLGKHGDATVHRFVLNLVKAALYIILAVTVVAILGVPMASMVALIASAGVAIGLALQGSLSNLAGGIMLLIFRPFKLDDFIDASGISGTVVDIGIFYTTIRTPDNKSVTIPNGSLMNDKVTNFSVHDTRRVDFTFNAAYGSDVDKINALLLEEAAKHEMVLKDPAPFARLSQQNEHSLTFTLRVWTESANYWTVNFDLLEAINARFAAEGIEIPFNQIDVHVKNK